MSSNFPVYVTVYYAAEVDDNTHPEMTRGDATKTEAMRLRSRGNSWSAIANACKAAGIDHTKVYDYHF